MSPRLQKMLDEAVRLLGESLGTNLYSCSVYGSAVRGNFVDGASDLNVLIVLNDSAAGAHQQIARALSRYPLIEPFILGRRGLERSMRAFAPKFASIRRNYRVLIGTDPFLEIRVDSAQEKFLCEQALRNLRLRLVYAFVTRSRNKGYQPFVMRNLPGLFVNLSELLRLNQGSIPVPFEDRIPLFEREFKLNGATLRELLELRQQPRDWSDAESETWHERIFPLLDAALHWIETHW